MKKDNLDVDKAHTHVVWPAHVPGVPQGGRTGMLKKTNGLYAEGEMVKGTARRSTGIRHYDRNPIDPRSPNFSPP